MAPECQSFLDNVGARDGDIDRRIAAGESLARDRFDSDCVLGTHRSNGDFPVLAGIPRMGGGCLARFCLCNGVLASSQPFRPLCLCPKNSVSRQWRPGFEETRFECMTIKPKGEQDAARLHSRAFQRKYLN